jgi:hypothetical protein
VTISWLPWWLRGAVGRWLWRSGLLFLFVTGFVGGIIWLGHWTSARLREDQRYWLAVAEIECDVPDGMARLDFLDEVQYHSRLPDRINLLDDEVGERLRAAFARHPWVARVEQVTVMPPRRIVARLQFRMPVLAVRWDGELRAVDGNGVLLPKQAATNGLPVYEGTPRPPRGPAGAPWGDADLELAARKLAAAQR